MNRNPFLTMDRTKATAVLAKNLTLIIGNNITSEALNRRAVGSDDLFVDLHLVDRVGAMLNALMAMGYEWDADGFYQELKERNKTKMLAETPIDNAMSRITGSPFEG